MRTTLGMAMGLLMLRAAFAGDTAGPADPLSGFAAPAQSEIRVTEVIPAAEPCTQNELERFEGPEWASPATLVQLRRQAEQAVRSANLPLCECRVRYVETPWNRIPAFEIEHGSCWTLTVRVIAVDPGGTCHLLTGDLLLAVDGDRRVTTADEALANFNRLTEREGTVINTSDVAQNYLESFLRVYLPRAGSYLPNRKIADMIAGLRVFGAESDSLKRAFEQIRQPVVSVSTGEHDGYRGTAYTWEWSYGGIQRIDLAVGSSGRVSVVESTYAEQK